MVSKEKKPKKEKAVKVPGVVNAIKWFQDKAGDTQDVEEIREAAVAEKYSPSTISIQLGRLRGMGLLPQRVKAEKVAAEKPSKKEGKKKVSPRNQSPTSRSKSFHPVPKPSQASSKAPRMAARGRVRKAEAIL